MVQRDKNCEFPEIGQGSARRMNLGRIILEGETTEPYVLKDFKGVALFEIVEGQYRIENLEESEDVKEKGA